MSQLSSDFVLLCRPRFDDRARVPEMLVRDLFRLGASSDGQLKRTSWARLVVGVVCLLIALFFRQIVKLVPMTMQGMFCDDDSIKYPYKRSTISTPLLTDLTFLVSLITIVSAELFNTMQTVRYGRILCRQVGSLFIHPTLFYVVAHYGVFLFGVCLTDALTRLGKNTVGRLRPNFVDLCRPNLTLCENNPNAFIAQIECLNEDSEDARSSFPSGHSSDIFYLAIFCIMYLQARMELRSTLKMIRSLIQVALFTLAYYCAMTRVKDNKHRGSDALAGSLLGTFIAISTVAFVANNFRRGRYHHNSENNSDYDALLDSSRSYSARPSDRTSALLADPKQVYGSTAQDEPPSDSGISNF